MGKATGFMEYSRELPARRPVAERINDFREVEGPVSPALSARQATRCMNCGTPFCHSGCPLGNNIPEFNAAVSEGNWKLAFDVLQSTNNFPEFTGRVCPAPCEAACVLGINQPPVTIEYLEKTIIERAFEYGFVTPRLPASRTGKKVAVIGSGPAGLAAAAQLNTAGHHVVVYERAEAPGGLLRFGIPDFKLDKSVVDRRIALMESEGIEFRNGVNLSGSHEVTALRSAHDAIVLATGSTVPRDLPVPGRNSGGIHFAMDFLCHQNRIVTREAAEVPQLSAKGKRVVILGGGDTGADCLGTSHRQGAASVMQLEILPKPPNERNEVMPWPTWPIILRTSTSHEEGGDREWAMLTKEFMADHSGNVSGLRVVAIEWDKSGKAFHEVTGTECVIPCEMVLLALGFTGSQRSGLLDGLGVLVNERGVIQSTEYQTNVRGIFAAGDARRGQSLVVWAIHEGREAARHVDQFLMGTSFLESRDAGILQAT